jgi:hypothetical protein
MLQCRRTCILKPKVVFCLPQPQHASEHAFDDQKTK